jgi:beta-phosphoglucomutase
MTGALQAIIFDFDGVIANSEPLHYNAFQQTLAEEGLIFTKEEYYSRYLGFNDVELFQALARDRAIAMSEGHVTSLVARKGAKLQELLRGGHIVFPGALDFIRTAAASVPIAIASGALRHEIAEIIDGAGVASLFSTIVAAGDTPQGKPSPAPYLLAFEQLRRASGRPLEADRCVAIEDSRWGLESAKSAGLRRVGVTHSYPADGLPGAELFVRTIKDLTLTALDELCSRPAQ